MSFEHRAEVLRRYRGYATWGGAAFGVIVGTIVSGQHFREWNDPLTTWGVVTLVCGLIGVLVGYLYFPIIVRSAAGGGSGVASDRDGSPSGIDSGGSGGGDDGGSDGGGGE